ncbi:glycosyltransferase family 4 protein [Chloroflexota bacterium]
MKICYIASARSYYHPKWFEYFIERGYQVNLISPDAPRVEMSGVNIHCFPQFKFKVLRLAFTFFFGGIFSRKIINREKPDILHAIELDEGFCAATSGFHPFVMTPNGSDLLVWAKKHLLIRIIAKYVFSKADVVTSDSILLKESSIALGARQDRNYIIQWGVDLNQFNPRVDRGRIREKYDLGDSPLVLHSRPLMHIYNIDTIIRCLPEILKEVPSVKIMFVYGFRDKEVEMKKLAADLGVDDATIFVGSVDYEEMPYYHAAADVCLSVPSSDSSPRAVYEAMACGVPPILSDLPWTKDFITPEQNALIVPVRDHQALATAILRLLADGELRQKITKANLKLVDEKLNYHKHMAKMESIYQSLC